MLYTKQTWVNGALGGTPVNASRLSHMEDGIANSATLDSLKTVIDFGADPSGVRDATAAINAAGGTGSVIFPPGSYLYNGTGITNPSLHLQGAGKGLVTITLGPTSYLYTPSTVINSLYIAGIRTVGGKGIVAQSFSGADSAGAFRIIQDNYFYNYTGTAIGSLASDSPYWQIRRNVFWAANDTTTMGIALAGLSDSCDIENNDFRMNRVHIKLMQGANNACLSSNGFLHFAAYVATPRIDVWIVPAPTSTNAGTGFVIDTHNKFGNEFLDPSDYRILYADEDTASGADSTVRFPLLSSDSTGYISGHNIAGGFYGTGGTATNHPLIYSTTQHLFGNRWADIIVGDGTASCVVGLRTTTLSVDHTNSNNVIGPIYGVYGVWGHALLATNAPGIAKVIDTQGMVAAGSPLIPLPNSTSNPSDYINQLTTGIRSFTGISGGTLANVNDAYGETDASELTFTGTSSQIYAPGVIASPTLENMWIEFDLAPGSSSPLATLLVILQDYASVRHATWNVTTPTSGVVPIRLGPHNWRTPGSGGWNLIFQSLAAGKVQIGRVRMYQSRNPILKDLSIARATTTTSAPSAGGGNALPATPAGYVTVYIGGVARKVAYY